MSTFLKFRKFIAAFFLVVMIQELVLPVSAYALTSGPSQPEMKGFEPIGNSDMVDLSSGDFSYNIPLMDVGGYPVNMAYSSGAGMDEEASWTGYGWNLNVGSLNRNLRGLPDDFNGSDMLERNVNLKDHKTYGGRFSMTLDALGIPVSSFKGKTKKTKKLKLSLTASVGIKIDNYRGIGMEVGINPGLSLTGLASGENTKNLDSDTTSTTIGGNLNLSLSSFEGAGIDVNGKMIMNKLNQDDKKSSSKAIGFGYNSRGGGAKLTLDFFKDPSLKFGEKLLKKNIQLNSFANSLLDFSDNSYSPSISNPTKTESYNLSLDFGPELFIPFVGFGVSGFYSNQKLAEKSKQAPAFGFFHLDKGQNEPAAVLDFNREKDIPYSRKVKFMPIPVPSFDLFSATSQDGAGQYRIYRGSSGVFFDAKEEIKSDNISASIEGGPGFYFDAGVNLYHQGINTVTKKWTKRNDFLPKGDFQVGSAFTTPGYEGAYFKRVGEPVPYDNDYVNKIKGTSPVAVKLPANITNGVEGAKASDLLRTKSNSNGESIAALKRDKREVRNTTFSYLTANEASRNGLDKKINDYHPDSIVVSGCNTGGIRNSITRTAGYRKGHHFSEVTITGDDGKRSVYGIPVYNTYQEEVSFSVSPNLSLRNKGLINYSAQDNSVSNNKGKENYYSQEKTPPYATSYLLTGILSSDYVDRKGDGITDDDIGTAVKFNYTKLSSAYKWRTPNAYGQDSANYNEGFLSDALDDKANYVYGEKEIWYLHSIESKTMLAHFVTEDRLDGLGVTDNRGGVNTSVKLKRLKEIRLYSKSDLRLHNNDLSKVVPVKVVHFEYDYSLCRGLPNSVGNTGKLTLKRVYFTFGLNQKGKLNPYDFQYDTSYNHYDYRQYDRWGTFKDAANNPGGLNNSEFPYTNQDTAWTNKYVRAWQLTKITLPSGGVIRVQYESDDYGYVQDKRASQMCMLNGVDATGQSSGLINADYIYVNLPYAVSNNQELRERYFEGITNLYYKFFIDLDGKGHKEYVPGYAELDPIIKPVLAPGSTTIAKIKLKKFKGVNPIAKDGWQFIRTNLPKYAYPGSDNIESNRSDLRKAIEALVTAFGTIKELVQGFDGRAKAKGYSNTVELQKSWVRLCAPTWKKLGGGSRVHRVDISDDWASMGGSGAKTSTYSILYDYTQKDAKGRTISSGVASYEPMMGNDENPFRQPIRYSQNEFLGLNDYYYIEEPFGESFFPGASVVYSKITVKTIGSGDAETVNRTGTVVNEFYTAKDYPTKVDVLGLEQRKPASSKLFKLIGGISIETIGLSQGYSVETNDMHGKPKSTQVYNKSGQMISSVEYFYKSVNELAPRKELKNDVKVIDAQGVVTDGHIGMDIEMYTDMREQITDNLGESVKLSGGSGSIFIIPLPFFFPGLGLNYDRRNFRSSSTIKIVNRFAIQYKVKKIENGSSITSENLLWDAETGNVLLTKTQNEFDDPVYSFSYPAHWEYEGMGQAYKNLGTYFALLSTNSNGEITNSAYNAMLYPGDELIDLLTSKRYWVINSPISGVYKNRIVNADGAIQYIPLSMLKLIRSGRRNMANTAIATISSLNNPIVGNKLDVRQLTKVLDAKATTFSDEWSVPVPAKNASLSSSSCTIDDSCMSKFILAAMTKPTEYDPAPFYSTQFFEALTVADIFNFAYDDPGSLPTLCYENFLNGMHSDEFEFYQYNVEGSGLSKTIRSGDSAYLSHGCRLYFDSVTSRFNQLASSFNQISSFNHYFPNGPGCLGRQVCVVPITGLGPGCSYAVLDTLVNPSAPSCIGDHALPHIDTVMKFRLVCSGENQGCVNLVDKVINPYYTGVLGNWRPKSSYVYQVSRENLVTDPAKFGSTDIRKSGAYSVFNPFWRYNSGWQQNPENDERWIAANEITLFNLKGLELENKDALGRYSSAVFGYLESMPLAVASNSRYRELGYDGFEDYGFNLECSTTDTCNNYGHFNFKRLLDGSTIDTTSEFAHTGKYSLKIDGSNLTLVKTVYAGEPGDLLSFNGTGQYLLGSNEISKGFSPIPGKQYVLSFWLKDGDARDPATDFVVNINGSAIYTNVQKWPIVEGWKKVEAYFVIPSMATSFELQLESGSLAYVDDIRIHPFDAQAKTYAYDATTQRLMADLDENNFATFYEYDDEGTLIRVKKETDRGIMTIKETRSSYKKRQ